MPGANTQGKTLKEAGQLIIEANRELSRRETVGRQVILDDLICGVHLRLIYWYNIGKRSVYVPAEESQEFLCGINGASSI